VKKSTLALLVVAAVLIALTLLVTRDDTKTGPDGVTLDGYAKQEALDAEKQRGLLEGPLDIENPIDEIVIERHGEKIRLVRSGSGKDATWALTEPVDAPAVKYLVDKIVSLFKTKTESVYATSAKEADLPLYDLEADRRIGLTVKYHAEGESEARVYNDIDLWVGRTDKGDDAGGPPGRGGEGEPDTWVQLKSRPDVVYRMGGKDLRSPLEEDLDNLRDKKAFTASAEELTKLSVTAPDGRHFVLTGEKTEPPPPDADADENAPKPKAKVTWTLTEPAGLTADTSASSLARSFTGLRAKSFVPTAEAPKTALSGEVWTVVGETEGGETLKLTVQDGGKDDVWARVEGRDELMKLAGYTADGVRKTVEDVQDKKFLDVSPEAVTAVTFAGPDGPVSVARDGQRWRFTAPEVGYEADLSTALTSLTRLTCARWARPDEVDAARAALAGTGGVTGAISTAAGEQRVTFSAKMTEEPYDGRRWGVVGDPATAQPFLAQDFVATRFQKTTDELRQKKLFPGRDKADLRSVTVTLPGVATPIVYESPATGGDPVLTGVPEGKAANTAVVRTVISTATALAAKGFSDTSAADAGLSGDGVAKVALGWADGSVVTVSISSKLDGTDPYATVDAGPLAGSVFTLNTYQANNLKKTLDELVK